MSQPIARAWTLDEFFAWQERQPTRYELVGGQPLRMMVGVRSSHDLIVVNIVAALRERLRGTGCRPFTGEWGLETIPGQVRRPDVGVDCGAFDPRSFKAATPRLVVEVLSPSTRDFDTFSKIEEYKTVDSLDHILIVEPNEPEVVVWSRDASRAWSSLQCEGLDASTDLASLGITLLLAEIYDGVTFPQGLRLLSI